MVVRYCLSLISLLVVINCQSPPPPPAPAPAENGSFWDSLFPPSPPVSPTPPTPEGQPPAVTPGTSISDTVSQYADQALDKTGEMIKDGVKNAAGMIVPSGTQVTADQSLIDQAASYINLAPGVDADPNTIFGLYDALSELVAETPEGGVTLKMPTSKMLEKIKPWIDPIVDIGPLILALKGYEAFQKTKNAIGNVGDKIGGTAGDVKDGAVNAANTVKDVAGEGIDKVKDIFG